MTREHPLQAVVGLLGLLDDLIRHRSAQQSDANEARVFTSRLALATLVGAIPPDVRLQTLNHVLVVAVPDLLRTGPFVTALNTWGGGSPDAALTRLTNIAVEQAREAFAARPERVVAYRNYRQRLGLADLIGITEPAASLEEPADDGFDPQQPWIT